MNLFTNFAFCPKFLPNIPQKEKHQKTKIHACIFSMILLLAAKQYVQNIHIHAKIRKNTQTCAEICKNAPKMCQNMLKIQKMPKKYPKYLKMRKYQAKSQQNQANAAQILHNLAKWSRNAPPTPRRPSKIAPKSIKNRGFMA